ncbi:MAG: efflux RND transporter permease subunit [Pirellulales bacterium]
MKRTFFARHSFVILLITAFLMPFMLVGTRRSLLSNKNDVKSWLPPAYEETTTFKWFRERFDNDTFVMVSWEGCTLDDPRLPMLAKNLIPAEGAKLAPEHRFFKSARTGAELLDSLVNEQGVSREEALTRFEGSLIGPERPGGRETCLILAIDQDAEEQFDQERAVGQHKKEKFLHLAVQEIYNVAGPVCGLKPDQLHLGGPPVDNVAIDTEGEKSLFRLAGVSAVVGLLMSWWCLRSWKLTAMVFTTALFTAGLSLAAVWYSGDTMNAILLTMPSLVYVAATSGAIHLANYYRDTVRQSGIEGAPGRAVANAWLPLALATGTTAIGLASMCITELVPIRMFGLYSAVGVVISFFVLITYMPALLHYFPLKWIAEPRKSRLVDPGLSPRWRYVGEFIIRRNGLIAVGCIVVMVVCACGVIRSETSVRLMRLFSPDARIIQDYAWLEEHLGPLVPMEVVISIDRAKCKKLDIVEQIKLVGRVQQEIEKLEDVGSTLAAPTFAPPLPKRGGMQGIFERRAWISQLEKNRFKLRDYLVTDGGKELWRVSARVGALTNVDYGEFVKDIRAKVEPVLKSYEARGFVGIEATYTGLVPLVYKAQSSMLNGLLLNFVGDLVLIGIAIVFLMRDWSAGLLLMLPSVFPIAVVFGIMGWWGVVIDVGTVMVPAVALGVTVDDAIHFMLWCRHGQERGMTRPQAIMFAYEDCARAIYQSWGVIGLGLSAFALSNFMPTQRFGYLMFTMLTISSIGNLVLMPALLAGPCANLFWKRGAKMVHPSEKVAEPIPAPHEAPEEEEATILSVPQETDGEAASKRLRRDKSHRRARKA